MGAVQQQHLEAAEGEGVSSRRQWSDGGNRRSEVRGQKSEIRSQEAEGKRRNDGGVGTSHKTEVSTQDRGNVL